MKIALRYEYIHETRNSKSDYENDNNEKNNRIQQEDENYSYEEYIQNFQNNEISGTIKGMSKRDPVFKTWISESGLEKRVITDTPDIEYIPLVDRMVRILEILLKSNKNGVDLDKEGLDMSKFSWVCMYIYYVYTCICLYIRILEFFF